MENLIQEESDKNVENFKQTLEQTLEDMTKILAEQVGRKFLIQHWYNGMNFNLTYILIIIL